MVANSILRQCMTKCNCRVALFLIDRPCHKTVIESPDADWSPEGVADDVTATIRSARFRGRSAAVRGRPVSTYARYLSHRNERGGTRTVRPPSRAHQPARRRRRARARPDQAARPSSRRWRSRSARSCTSARVASLSWTRNRWSSRLTRRSSARRCSSPTGQTNALADGFVVVRGGEFVGVGFGLDLMRTVADHAGGEEPPDHAEHRLRERDPARDAAHLAGDTEDRTRRSRRSSGNRATRSAAISSSARNSTTACSSPSPIAPVTACRARS